MARVPGRDDIYEVADVFRQRCLVEGTSLLWPEKSAWSRSNLEATWNAFVEQPDEGNRSFFEKWRDQLAGQPEDVHRIAADVLALYYLFPSNVGRQSKLRSVTRVIGWKLEDDRPNMSQLEKAFASSLGSPGIRYLIARPQQLAFYLGFARSVISGDVDSHDREASKRLADEVRRRIPQGREARHILLHLLFPDYFQPMVSAGHREAIVKKFPELAGPADDVDEKLFSIRETLAEQHDRPTLGFYDEDIQKLWGAQSAEAIDLEAVADLLETGDLGDPDLHAKDDWKERVEAVTRPMLKRIAKRIDRPVRYFRAGGIAEKRQTFDNLHVRAGGFEGFVYVGMADEPGSGLERSLSWGLSTYGRESLAEEREATLESVRGPGFSVRTVDPAAGFRGKTVLLYRALNPEELRQQDAEQLLEEIASDVSDLVAQIEVDEQEAGAAARTGEPPSLDQLAKETYTEVDELQEIEALLREKKHVILEGPPGSGKTFVAEKFARYFTENPLEGQHDERLMIIQFHQSYGYEDFIQGIRPETNDQGQLEYHVRPGAFRRLCEVAERNPGRRFVMMIDEINRGNISRIFGELLFLLEYRHQTVPLPYSKADDPPFSIPGKVYLVGTMNTTDRSLALIDYALRRRFYFYRMRPVADGSAPVLENWLQDQEMSEDARRRVLRLFVNLNQKVEEEIDEHHQVGHSYFMEPDIGEAACQQRVWRRAILPLLEEYFYNRRKNRDLLDDFSIDKLLAGGDTEDAEDEEDSESE